MTLEYLRLLQIGLEPETPEEWSDMLYSDEYAAGDKFTNLESRAAQFGPTDRGLILIALTQDEANETAQILHDKFVQLMARNPLSKDA